MRRPNPFKTPGLLAFYEEWKTDKPYRILIKSCLFILFVAMICGIFDI